VASHHARAGPAPSTIRRTAVALAEGGEAGSEGGDEGGVGRIGVEVGGLVGVEVQVVELPEVVVGDVQELVALGAQAVVRRDRVGQAARVPEYKGYNGSPPSRSSLLKAPAKPIPPLSTA